MRNITIFLLIVIPQVSFGQFTANDLERLYKEDSNIELSNLFQEWSNSVDSVKIINNDTTKTIFSLIIDAISNYSVDTGYFLIQPTFPEIKINQSYYKISDTLRIYNAPDNLKLLPYNINNINAINSFIGPIPFQTKRVKRYIDKYEGKGHCIAKKRIKKYWSRIKFIDQYLFVPISQGHHVESWIKFNIKYIHFTSGLKEAVVRIESNSQHQTAIYKLENNKWKIYKVIDSTRGHL